MVEVRVESLRKTYGKVEALRGVSLNFRSGALTAILGPSGCGKTTLLRSIAGFIEVDAGRILFDAEEVPGLPPQRRGTAMVFQNYALWPHMTVFENVAYGLRLRGRPGAGGRGPGGEGGGARGDATLVVRASDGALEMVRPAGEGGVRDAVMRGMLEERLFLGAVYRHYVRLEGETVMVDSAEPVEAGPAVVRVPVVKLQVSSAG